LFLTCAAAALLAAPPSCAADPYEKSAKAISRIAERALKRRVAVLPFLPVAGTDTRGSMALAERITAHLSRQPGIEVVERTLLEKVLREQGLAQQGVLDGRQSDKVGRVLGVDCLLTGSILGLGDGRIEVNARLIDAVTARVLGAETLQVRRDWDESGFGGLDVVVLPPDLGEAGPLALPGEGALRDALGGGKAGCEDWEARSDRLQATVLELKARFWAARLREPSFSAHGLTRNPGSEVRSIALRQDLYRRIRELYEQEGVRKPSVEEMQGASDADQAAEDLRARCDR
jgi:TolB-like protein